MDLVMANQSGNSVVRDYRKGNWTVQETMVLIEAKKMDDERRLKRQHGESSEGRSKPAELRWKWVEDYCWRNGCLRSQNQCNDKWDNLMRDFKKVRDYERRLGGKGEDGEGSYWKIEKNERKDKNLPSNMLLQIYEALAGVVDKKVGQMVVVGGTGGGGSCSNPNMTYVEERERSISNTNTNVHPSLPPQMLHTISPPIPVLPLPPPTEPPLPPSAQPSSLPYSHPLPPVDSDTSEYSDSPPKRRRRGRSRGRGRGGGGGGEGTSASGTTSHSQDHQVGSAISKSASIIAEAIQASEEREERRHKDLLSLHERRLKIEESKAEINRQGINGLVDAINKLANSVFAVAASKNPPTPP